jgi:hypothetical protein
MLLLSIRIVVFIYRLEIKVILLRSVGSGDWESTIGVILGSFS